MFGKKDTIKLNSTMNGEENNKSSLELNGGLNGELNGSLNGELKEGLLNGEDVRLTIPVKNDIHNIKYPMHLKFNNLNVKVDDKYLLQNINGELKPGEILAIMGPSGAGKSTLLNILAGRAKKGVEIESGEILINNEKATKRLRRGIGYVLQSDNFFSHLTVEQTLQFVGELRLPDALSSTQKCEVVDEVIDELGLNKCKKTVMGGGLFITGCSGGEKKRCSIAAELITNPSLLMMDEPTSGLDSTTACNLIDSVKRLAKSENRAVVTTIHQPPSHVFHMFDKLLLLCNGRVAYFGNTCGVLNFFEFVDMPCYKNWNPADFIMDKLSAGKEIEDMIVEKFEVFKSNPAYTSPCEYNDTYVKNIPREIEKKQKISISDRITKKMGSPNGGPNTNSTLNTNGSPSTNGSLNTNGVHVEITQGNKNTGKVKQMPKWPTGYFTQVKALCKRAFFQTKKEMLDKITIIQTFVIGLIAGLLWFDTPYEEEFLYDRRGVIFFTLVYIVINPMFQAIMSFPAERNTIAKERAAGMYRLSAYYTAKSISELPVLIIQPVLLYTVIYWLSGLNRSPIYLLGVFLIITVSFLGQSIGLCIGAGVKDFKKSIALTIVVALSMMLLAGFYTTRIPHWLRWGKYVSHITYAYNVLVKLEFEYAVRDFKCTSTPPSIFDICRGNSTSTGYIPGRLVADHFSYIDFGLASSFIILWGYIFIFRAAFYYILRFFNKPE